MKANAQRKEFRKLDKSGLRERLISSQEELFNLRFQLATGGSQNNAEVNRVRKQIARIHTLLREQELAEVNPPKARPEPVKKAAKEEKPAAAPAKTTKRKPAAAKA